MENRQLVEFVTQYQFSGYNYFAGSELQDLKEYYQNTKNMFISAMLRGDSISLDKYASVLGKIIAVFESNGFTFDQVIEYLDR